MVNIHYHIKENTNPDIIVDSNNEIWLKIRLDGELINTGLNAAAYTN